MLLLAPLAAALGLAVSASASGSAGLKARSWTKDPTRLASRLIVPDAYILQVDSSMTGLSKRGVSLVDVSSAPLCCSAFAWAS